MLLVGTIGYLPFYLQAHKADLEAAAGEALGRPVAIDGVALGWLWHPRPGLAIVLRGLRVSNPDWDTDRTLGPHLLEAERVEVKWDLGALLHRQVRIDQLRSEQLAYSAVLANYFDGLIHACVARREGTKSAHQAAQKLLIAARSQARAYHLRPYQLAAEDQLAELQSGQALGNLEARMIQQGIVRPDRFLRLYALSSQ